MIPGHITQVEFDEIDFDESCSHARITEFVRQQLALHIPNSARILTVDGFDGVGKSTLSRSLADALQLPQVGLDDYLVKDQGRFLKALRFYDISKAIDSALDKAGRVIVEGCLVDLALKHIGRNADFRIYIMRTSRMWSGVNAEWIDKVEVLYGDKSADDLIAEREDRAQRWAEFFEEIKGRGRGNLPSLEKELIRYHRDVRPHDQADFIVKIVRRT